MGMGAARRLIARFGSLEAAFTAPEADVSALHRVRPDALMRWRRADLAAMRAQLCSLAIAGIAYITPDDVTYPASLLDLAQAPVGLFMRGQITEADRRRVTVVGTREPSAAGFAVARQLSMELAAAGYTVVSGLAVGIDTAAHAGALIAPGGRTLVVLGSGLEHIHPRGNRSLAAEAATRGALLTEYPPDQVVDAGRLPKFDPFDGEEETSGFLPEPIVIVVLTAALAFTAFIAYLIAHQTD
jgi:DNA processing protein